MKITNVSPLGALDVPLLRAVIDAGETLDVTEDQARVLLLQPGNYAPADKPAKALAAALTDQHTAGDPDPRTTPHDPAQTPADGAATEGN